MAFVRTAHITRGAAADGARNRLKGNEMANSPQETGYAHVNSLEIYYEIHGAGRPLVLLHGALSAIGSSFAKLIPTLAQTHQVIAIDQQAHGRTADIDRPLSVEQMAEDTAALLRQLHLTSVDHF